METLDIHTGGVDLAFPHHENEIAQSEGATGHPFVRLWLHAEHLIIDGQKMSKSLGNFYTLRDLFARGQKPSTIRFLLLSVPYRRQLNFTEDGLKQAENSIERLRNFVARLKTAQFPAGSNADIVKRVEKAEGEFEACLADDENTAVALASVFEMVSRGEYRDGPRHVPAAGRAALACGHGKVRRDSCGSPRMTTPKSFASWALAPKKPGWARSRSKL